MLPKVKDELERMETSYRKGGRFDRVVLTHCCLPKPNENVRIFGDFIQLNKAILRENHPMPTIEQTLGKLVGAKVISKVDSNSGFWQRKLKDNLKLSTTFISPWGRVFHLGFLPLRNIFNRVCKEF